MRVLCVALIGTALLATAGPAQAQDASSDDSRSERLERSFAMLASDERAHRRFLDETALAFSAAATGAGVALIAQDKNSAAPYVFTGIAGLRLGWAGYDLFWGRDAYEGLAEKVAEMRREQLTEAELLRLTESYWWQAAERARAARIRAGITESVVGTGLVATALVFAFDQSAFGLSASDRTTRAQMFVGLGLVLTGLGAADLLIRDPVEVGYQIFRSNNADDANAVPHRPSFTVGLSGPDVVAAVRF